MATNAIMLRSHAYRSGSRKTVAWECALTEEGSRRVKDRRAPGRKRSDERRGQGPGSRASEWRCVREPNGENGHRRRRQEEVGPRLHQALAAGDMHRRHGASDGRALPRAGQTAPAADRQSAVARGPVGERQNQHRQHEKFARASHLALPEYPMCVRVRGDGNGRYFRLPVRNRRLQAAFEGIAPDLARVAKLAFTPWT